MRHIKAVFAFGWPYMRRYQSRLWLGVLCGVLLGLSNASFIWATKTIFSRLSPEPAAATVIPRAPSNALTAAFGSASMGCASGSRQRLTPGCRW